MHDYYEEASVRVKYPLPADMPMFLPLEMEKPHTILYKWEVTREQWFAAMKPLKKIYVTDSVRFFYIIISFWLAVPFFASLATKDFFLGFKYFIREYASWYYIYGCIFIPVLLFIVFKTIYCYKSICNPVRNMFFMTNMGIFNGRVYARKLERYRINEEEQKLSILLTQINMGGLTAGGPLSGIGGRTFTFWNDFFYNEADKKHIFTIIALWEQYNIIKAEESNQAKIVHNYLESQPADEIERLMNSYEKPLYVIQNRNWR